MEITTAQAPELLLDVLRAKLVPMLVGSPGMGKSDIFRKIAEEQKLKVIDVRLAQSDPTDLLGLPSVNPERTKAGYLPMNTFPIKGDPVPEGYKGWLLFLDEMNSGNKTVQAAAYKLILDRQVGEYDLHEKVAICCAGNLATDNAIVNSLSTAMQSRLIHFQLAISNDAWHQWALSHGIDHRIISYLHFRPENLFNFSPSHSDHTFACSRTWEFLSRLIAPFKTLEEKKRPLIAGTIGEGAAVDFFTYCQIFKSLPTIQNIVTNGKNIAMPNEPAVSFAITGMIAHHITKDTIDAAMEYVTRMGIEFQIICLQQIVAKDRGFLNSISVQKWVTENSQALL